MAVQLSVAARNARLDAIETAAGVTAHLELFTGTPPASCATASSGTLLANLTLPSDWMSNAAAGSKALLGTWSGSGAATGTVGYFRLFDSAVTTCHIQGTVSFASTAWAATTAYVVGQKVNKNSNVYNCTVAGTSGSGANPTGTGTGQVDGGCTWDYVTAVGDMTMDNTSVATSQALSVATFTLTDANA